MLTIARDTVAAFHYVVSTAEDGAEVDRSGEGAPLVALIGHQNIIGGLEQALIGRKEGDAFQVDVAATDAYGQRDAALDFVVGTDAFPEEVRGELKPGFRFRATHPQDEQRDIVYTIIGNQGEDVAVTGNHRLAGQDLRFQIQVAWVRPATDDERAHGHIHDDCCGGHSSHCADGADGGGHEHGDGCGHHH
jgi:FKBP-type peptidyl-prolyl cis-trans isomerase SlyD